MNFQPHTGDPYASLFNGNITLTATPNGSSNLAPINWHTFVYILLLVGWGCVIVGVACLVCWSYKRPRKPRNAVRATPVHIHAAPVVVGEAVTDSRSSPDETTWKKEGLSMEYLNEIRGRKGDGEEAGVGESGGDEGQALLRPFTNLTLAEMGIDMRLAIRSASNSSGCLSQAAVL
ncbi:hypothetical protein BJ878DRAFT_574402 [Calycina marina]|uniref:Uncharacterized protein n=1 Tax=Calycina marina TaxID=1763456 RepID=A0A9P8CGS8_9HELO|nr:hypothetical protein BJ878DRAFT_574402 [Calycina marina]